MSSVVRSGALNDREKRWLLILARATIADRLEDRSVAVEPPEDGPLTELRGAFVTLTAKGALRGCIGHVTGGEPLWRSVRTNAVNAAFHDPRFQPVDASEFSSLTVEVSALSILKIGSSLKKENSSRLVPISSGTGFMAR